MCGFLFFSQRKSTGAHRDPSGRSSTGRSNPKNTCLVTAGSGTLEKSKKFMGTRNFKFGAPARTCLPEPVPRYSHSYVHAAAGFGKALGPRAVVRVVLTLQLDSKDLSPSAAQMSLATSVQANFAAGKCRSVLRMGNKIQLRAGVGYLPVARCSPMSTALTLRMRSLVHYPLPLHVSFRSRALSSSRGIWGFLDAVQGRKMVGKDQKGNTYWEVKNPGGNPDPKREIDYIEKHLVSSPLPT